MIKLVVTAKCVAGAKRVTGAKRGAGRGQTRAGIAIVVRCGKTVKP